MAIPVVDLADFTHGTPAQKAAFVEALGKAYEDVGFVAVKNHGVPDEVIANHTNMCSNSLRSPLKKNWITK